MRVVSKFVIKRSSVNRQHDVDEIGAAIDPMLLSLAVLVCVFALWFATCCGCFYCALMSIPFGSTRQRHLSKHLFGLIFSTVQEHELDRWYSEGSSRNGRVN